MKALEKISKPLGCLLAIFLFVSCYSVRLRSTEGVPMPCPVCDTDDYYRDLQVIELDTTITIGLENKDFELLIRKSDRCPTGKLHTVEYRNTLGSVLLAAVTFGRKRRVKIKYICTKPVN